MRSVPRWRLALVVVLLLSARLSAQNEPDFTGRWLLADSKAAPGSLPHTLIVQPTLRRTDVRGEPIPPFIWSFLVERQTRNGTTSDEYVLGVEGGVTQVSALTPGRGLPAPRASGETRFRARLDGEQLVIDTAHCPAECFDRSHWSSSVETWRVDSQQRLLITVTDTAPGKEPVTVTALYRKE